MLREKGCDLDGCIVAGLISRPCCRVPPSRHGSVLGVHYSIGRQPYGKLERMGRTFYFLDFQFSVHFGFAVKY